MFTNHKTTQAFLILITTLIITLNTQPIPFTIRSQIGIKTSSVQRLNRNLILNFTVTSDQFISYGNQTAYCTRTYVQPLEMSSSVEKYCENIPLSQGQKYSFTFYDYFDYACPSSLYFLTKTDTVPLRILEIYLATAGELKQDEREDKMVGNLKAE